MSKIWSLIAAVVLAGAISATSACERMYGVSHFVPLEKFPDRACVRTVVEGIPEIQDYDETHWPPGEKFLSDGLRKFDFYVETGHCRVQISVRDNGDGTIDFGQDYVSLEPIAQGRAAEARPVMFAVEEALARSCEITELKDGVKEWCSGVDCPPMD